VEQFTVRQMAEEFRDRHLKPNVRTWAETWRIIEKDVLPEWGDRDANSIAPREVVTLLDGILDRGAQRMANKVRSILFQMFKFGVGRGMVDGSPVVLVSRPSTVTTTRDRILTDDEIKAFWNKIEEADMLPRLRHALRLLLITGQRRGEVALATWDEFDLDAKVWRIPGERTKSGKRARSPKAHEVPLSQLAIDTLATIKAEQATLRAGEGYSGPFLFPSPHWDTEAAIDPHALTRAVSRNRKLWGIPSFTVHDLRRTVRSNLAALGVDPVVARKVVNHSLAGMDAVYDRYDYGPEKRQALDLWAERLGAIVAGKKPKIVPLRATA
jgi:integrase